MLEPKIGLLFSGQGSQVQALGKDFYELFPSVKKLYNQYPHIRDIAFHGSEKEIAETQNTQRLLILFHIAVTNLLKEQFPIAGAMGISLGEYGALYSANVLTADDTVHIIEQRADSMANASANSTLSSVAVLNSNFDWLFAHAGENSYYVSNINSPNQVVITGENLSFWTEKLQAEGYKRILPLAISGGFHSPYMKQTEILLEHLFETTPFGTPDFPIYFNFGAPEMDIKKRMSQQVSHTINVHQSLEQISENCDILIEIGANKILQNMIKKINRDKIVYPLQTVEDFEKVRKEIGK